MRWSALLRPLADVFTSAPVRANESLHEGRDESRFQLLTQDNKDHLHGWRLSHRRRTRCKLTVLSEEEIIAGGHFTIEAAILEPLQSQRTDGIDAMPEPPQWLDRSLREGPIEGNPHRAAGSLGCASSCKAPRMASPGSAGD